MEENELTVRIFIVGFLAPEGGFNPAGPSSWIYDIHLT